MKTIRRGYFYLVSLISLEVVTWSVIGLLQSIFDTTRIGGGADQLAGALSSIVVGVVVFAIHWRVAQKESSEDSEEQFSGVRSVFFYGTLAILLITSVQYLMILIYRTLANLLDIEIYQYGFGSNHTATDSLVAILINLVIAYYFYQILQSIWDSKPSGDAFTLSRRISRYLWKLYGLGIAYGGIIQILTFLLSFSEDTLGAGRALTWGITLSLVGIPIWLFNWRNIQASLTETDEQTSTVRQVVLYLLTFLGVVISLGSASGILFELLETLLDTNVDFSDLLRRISQPITIGLPASLVWFYFGGVIKQDRESYPQAAQRSGLLRLYFYILAFLGLGATFVGLELLVIFLIQLIFGSGDFFSDDMLPSILTAFIVGLPLWLRNWTPMNLEALAEGEEGDHARRSVNRKGYLYLTLFISVMGIMGFTGYILYLLISALLGNLSTFSADNLLETFGSLGVFVLLGVYHLGQLRSDNLLASASLSAQHADFTVVVLESGEGEFSQEITAAIQAQIKDIQVAVHPIGEPFDDSLINASVVVLSSSLAANPPEAVRLWLDEFGGMRVVVPVASENWVWVGIESDNLTSLAKSAAKTVSLLAEGQDVIARSRSVWVYVLAGLFGLPFLCILFSLLAEFAF